jgi:hypothetical protein
MNTKKFKKCPNCGHWFTALEIMESPTVEPIGMRFDEEDSNFNLYFFNHTLEDCDTTFVIEVNKFLPFIMEPVAEKVLTGTEVCEGYCTRLDDLLECTTNCYYASFRRLLLSMIETRKVKAQCPTE